MDDSLIISIKVYNELSFPVSHTHTHTHRHKHINTHLGTHTLHSHSRIKGFIYTENTVFI